MRTIVGFLLVLMSVVDATKDFLRELEQVTGIRSESSTQRRSESERQELTNLLLSRATLRRLEDGDGDDAYDFPLDEYAMKYLGCQNVKSFSEDLAADEDATTVLQLNRFVVFRLCNSNLCSSYNTYGCEYDFGEYVIAMEDYLDIMYQYHYARYEEYCQTCILCMNPVSDDEVNDDDSIYNISNYVNYTDDGGYDDDLYNYTNVTDDDAIFNAVTDCEYYEACLNYKRACRNFGVDTITYEDYFGCAKFAVGQNVAYLGPHCASDGYAIHIGIFEDEYCQEYIGDLVDISQYTGMHFSDDGMGFYANNKCISCLAEDEYTLYEDQEEAEEVYELCDVMYQAAGKCNRYLNTGDVDETYGSENQADAESMTCNFVESLIENNYDTTGEILLTSSTFNSDNWKDYHEYQKVIVTHWQTIGLVFSSIIMVWLGVWACMLHRKVANRTFYNPNSLGSQPGGGRLSRIQSGIMMGRSSSGSSGYHLS
eukprot:CAMPEP_0194064114 /NCGR_PEP_ID=MMETSP0009_2-20130614/82182_1 /TAXON_ID=210454 /ORGANISM="Grammatophora oceanica, Strain CCMP 410" /LENGTH=482 /DNA_ID=CAMNT_0038716495 /DNA_START=87 /DNA_END=1535 /DNA_ORIENTATION=+